jgi:putative DNA primase/helicase
VTWLTPQIDAIPPDLQALPWVLWRAAARGTGKPTKVPYCVANPNRKASTTDPATWATFEDAVDVYSVVVDIRDPVPIAGLGPVLTLTAGISCLDLDRVIDVAGQLDTRAQTIVERCDSWTEISPSGTGLHIFVRGAVPVH